MSSSCSGWLYVKSQGWSTATTKLHACSSSHDIMRKKRITQHIPAGRPGSKKGHMIQQQQWQLMMMYMIDEEMSSACACAGAWVENREMHAS